MNIILGDKLDRLISTQVAISLFVVFLVIGFLDFFFQLLNEFQDIDDNYSLSNALFYCFSSMPFRLYDLLPYFCLIGMVVGLGSLVDSGEMIGARVLGKSYFLIGIAAFRPLIILMFLGLLASEYYIPNISQSALEGRAEKKQELASEEGYWMNNPEGFLYFQYAPDKETIKNIKFIQHDKNFKPLNLIKSDTAVAEKNNWILSKPLTKTINDNILTTPSEKISISKGLQGIKTVLDPKYLSLSDLSLLIKTSNEGFRKRSLSLEYWKKILQPFITFSLLLLSLSFIFGPMRDQKSSQRIIVSLVVAFCFDLSNKLLGSISIVTGTSVFLAVLLPALVISLFGLISLRRLK